MNMSDWRRWVKALFSKNGEEAALIYIYKMSEYQRAYWYHYLVREDKFELDHWFRLALPPHEEFDNLNALLKKTIDENHGPYSEKNSFLKVAIFSQFTKWDSVWGSCNSYYTFLNLSEAIAEDYFKRCFQLKVEDEERKKAKPSDELEVPELIRKKRKRLVKPLKKECSIKSYFLPSHQSEK